MIERAVTAQVPFAWLTGDAVYGNDRRLRVWLEQQDLHFVLAVAGNAHVWPDLQGQRTVAQLAASPSAGLGQAVGGQWCQRPTLIRMAEATIALLADAGRALVATAPSSG